MTPIKSTRSSSAPNPQPEMSEVENIDRRNSYCGSCDRPTSSSDEKTLRSYPSTICHTRHTSLEIGKPLSVYLPRRLSLHFLSLNQAPQTLHSGTSSQYASSSDDVANVLTQQAIGAAFHSDRSQNTLVAPEDQLVCKESWPTSNEPPSELSQLPIKRAVPIWRRIRHQLFNAYQRLFSVVILANIAALICITCLRRDERPFGPKLDHVATATAANVTACILMRQEDVINGLYTAMCAIPHCTPLRFRRWIAKFYQFGGVHSGCALACTMWYIFYTVLLTQQYLSGEFTNLAVVALTYSLVILLILICLFSMPKLRFKSHNTFEAMHRYGGWSAVLLFWAQILLLCINRSQEAGSSPLGLIIIQTPSFWFLIAISACIIAPWIRLRKVEAWTEVLSGHAIRIHFNYTQVGIQLGIRIANSPLKEWHPFAAIPEADGSSFSIVVSDAGDWTHRQIQNPRTSYWVRGIPLNGMLRMACVFKRVVVLTTGSGIGPCLSLLIAHSMPCRVLWSSKRPKEIFGQGTIDAVLRADEKAVIIDTAKTGRPDMIGLAYHMYKESNAEAVFIVSNIALTRKVVYGLESRGIPAYGPIWDS